jgi:DNA (cytosine-5)-methyltransferase 1
MVLHVKESDTRCPFVAGMEDVSVDKVLRPRDCVLTNKPYPFHSFRDVNSCSFPPGLTEKQIKEQVFHGGRLVCRLVNIRFISKNGKPYSGIVRFLYGRESDTTAPMTPNDGPGLSRSTPIPIEEEDQSNGSVSSHGLAGLGKRRARSNSLEVLEQAPTKRKSPHPTKRTQYTFGDVFCGAGGASQGAKQAGLVIIWGLDNDSAAIEAYGLNHTGALRFRRNAHNFPPRGYTNEELRVDILHLSPPCCFFSPAQYVYPSRMSFHYN